MGYKRETENGKMIYPSSLITKKMRAASNITIIGRKWFDKVNGNTYHATMVLVDGENVGFSGMCYGYGDSWKQTGTELLIKAGYIKGVKQENGHIRGIRSKNGCDLSDSALYDFICKSDKNRAKIVYIEPCGYVRQRDLKKW